MQSRISYQLTGTGSATDLPTVPSEQIPNLSFKNICVSCADTVGLKVANTDWGMYQLHTYRPFCCLLCWQLDDRDNRTRIAGHNQVITSQWKCPQRSFPHWQGVMSWTQWPGRLLGMMACRPTIHTSRDWSKCYSCGRTGHALIHLSKWNIKSFLGVIPHVNMSWIYLYNFLGLFTPKTRVSSAAEILLRIYQNPIHLNGTRWRTTFWR